MTMMTMQKLQCFIVPKAKWQLGTHCLFEVLLLVVVRSEDIWAPPFLVIMQISDKRQGRKAREAREKIPTCKPSHRIARSLREERRKINCGRI